MTHESKNVTDNIIEAKINIDAKELQKEKDAVAKAINSKNPLPGFRPGHAPTNIVASTYGLAEFNREVATRLIRSHVINYLIENNINPVIDPKIEINKLDEVLVFTAIFTTRPEITVGNYEKIKGKKPKVKEVKKDEVDKVITNLHEKSNFGATQVDPETGEKFILDSKGQKVLLGKSKQGPLNDDFAKQFGLNSLAELRERIEKNLMSENERQAEVDLETNLLEELVKITKVKLPQTLIDLEVEGMINRIQSQVENMGGNFENYLKEQKQSRESLTKEFEKNAIKTLTASLALDEIAKEKQLTISDELINANIHPEHLGHEGEKESVRLQLLRREALSLLKKASASS